MDSGEIECTLEWRDEGTRRRRAELAGADRSTLMLRALIVDDDPPFRRFLRAVLASDGYETMTAADGRAGLDLFKRHGPFDVVLTDVMMPLMSGSQLGRYLRQITPDIKVLYVTGSRDALLSDKSQLSPGEAVLEKPCSPAHVIDAVRVLVNACDTDSSR